MKVADTCEIAKTHPANVDNQRYAVPLPESHPQSNPELWESILASRNKREIIQAFRQYASSHGILGNAPEQVHDKLDRMTD